MSPKILAASWPLSRLGEAIEVLGRRSGFAPGGAVLEAPPADLGREDAADVGRWIEGAAQWLGLQAEPVEVPYPEVATLLATGGPALVFLPDPDDRRFLVLLPGRRRTVRVLTPERTDAHLAIEEVRAALCAALEAPHRERVARMLEEAATGRRRRVGAETQLLRQMLGAVRIGGAWLIRPGTSAGVTTTMAGARVGRRALTLFLAHGAQYAGWIASWGLLGVMTLGGRLDRDLLLVWLLLLVSLLPLRLLTTYLGGLLSIDAGVYLRQRLLTGALRLDPAEIRHMGAGQLLGRTLEAEAIESFGTSGAVLGVTALVELVVVAGLLSVGAGGVPHVAALVGWAGVVAGIWAAYHRRRAAWTEDRLAITNELVEQMVGHQTRAVQEPRHRWSEAEDQALERYLHRSRGLDRVGVALETVAPRGWLIIGLLALAPAFVAGPASPAALAASLGGVLLAYRAFHWLAYGAERLSGAWVAARRMELFWRAAQRRERLAPPRYAVYPRQAARVGERRPVLDVRGLRFRHPGHQEPVIRDLDLRIYAGDRLLLEGPSGSGKSTMGTLLSGARTAESGLLLLDGLDLATIGETAWRRRVVFVPQFHDNHVLIGTFAFNVLMGRGWPATAETMMEAEEVCRALGLGPLLDRMPSGMLQMVGETGWQLSHGEKSRLFIARAVLQNPDLIILDESFAALDPETLRPVMEYLFARDSAILAIAHP